MSQGKAMVHQGKEVRRWGAPCHGSGGAKQGAQRTSQGHKEAFQMGKLQIA
jgi:hypothetical protein